MDEDAYRDACRSVNPLPCSFGKAMLARQCGCEHLVHHHIAEREAVGCRLPSAREECLRLLGLFRRNARFALGLVKTPNAALPHGGEIKVQMGGLRGVARTMTPGSSVHRIDNVFALVREAVENYGAIEDFPYADIVKDIARYEGRTRRRK